MCMLMTTNRVWEAGRSALRRPHSQLHPQPSACEVEPRPSLDFRARKAWLHRLQEASPSQP